MMKKRRMNKGKVIDAVTTHIVLIAACLFFFFPVYPFPADRATAGNAKFYRICDF